jgi:hypothetical protein
LPPVRAPVVADEVDRNRSLEFQAAQLLDLVGDVLDSGTPDPRRTTRLGRSRERGRGRYHDRDRRDRGDARRATTEATKLREPGEHARIFA